MNAGGPPTTESLCLAYEDNFETIPAIMAASWPGAVLEDTAAGLVFLSGLQSFPCNVACRIRLDESDALAWAGALVTRCADRKLPAMWIIGPRSTPSGLGRILGQLGLTLVQQECMALDLRGWSSPAPPDLPLAINEVTTPESFSDYSEAFRGFGMDEATHQGKMLMLEQVGYGSGKPIRHFVGYCGGRPVGCSSIVFAAGVAGVYWVATQPAWRGRGIGTAMTAAACGLAGREGYRHCVLGASKLGAPVYRQMGFRDTGSLSVYRFQPPRCP